MNLKLEIESLLLLGFVVKVVKWSAALPSNIAEPSR